MPNNPEKAARRRRGREKEESKGQAERRAIYSEVGHGEAKGKARYLTQWKWRLEMERLRRRGADN
jgi:hypothetical protein